MGTIVKPQVELIKSIDSTDYEYLLAVSSDSLYIISQDRTKVVEVIAKGVDSQAYLCSASCEDDFLEAIHILKMDIRHGRDPRRWLFRESL